MRNPQNGEKEDGGAVLSNGRRRRNREGVVGRGEERAKRKGQKINT